jgi:predicted metal-binding protein
MTEKTKILVCVKCRMPGESKELPFDQRSGGRLYSEIAAAAEGADDVEIVPVECFSVCKRPVTIGLSAKGKWSYLYGDYPLQSAEAILGAARLYGGTSDGLIPWDQRPAALKTGVLARTPPGV